MVECLVDGRMQDSREGLEHVVPVEELMEAYLDLVLELVEEDD